MGIIQLKHPFINGCLGFQGVVKLKFDLEMFLLSFCCREFVGNRTSEFCGRKNLKRLQGQICQPRCILVENNPSSLLSKNVSIISVMIWDTFDQTVGTVLVAKNHLGTFSSLKRGTKKPVPKRRFAGWKQRQGENPSQLDWGLRKLRFFVMWFCSQVMI